LPGAEQNVNTQPIRAGVENFFVPGNGPSLFAHDGFIFTNKNGLG
jgi:hypothetical protein